MHDIYRPSSSPCYSFIQIAIVHAKQFEEKNKGISKAINQKQFFDTYHHRTHINIAERGGAACFACNVTSKQTTYER